MGQQKPSPRLEVPPPLPPGVPSAPAAPSGGGFGSSTGFYLPEVEKCQLCHGKGKVLAERVGNKLVVAYLIHDDDGNASNPMTNSDGQGSIYTKSPSWGGGVITDIKVPDGY